MANSSSYAPPNESPADLWNERSILDGLFLGSVGYGIHLTLYLACLTHLRPRGERNDQYILAYITLLFILGNIGNGTNIKWGEMTFIDNRNYPGGPGAYNVAQSTNPVAVICNSVYIVNSWLQDTLLIYRFWVIWGRNYRLLILPVLLFLASFVLSSMLMAELSRPGETIWSTISVNLAIPYWSISIALNVILTLCIAGRLFYVRLQLRHIMGAAPMTLYVSVSAMLIESASLYSINGIIFIVSYGINSPVQNLALPLLGQTQSIAPLLIIYRVAQGRAWSHETLKTTNTTTGRIRFRVKHRGSTTQSSSTLPVALAPMQAAGMVTDTGGVSTTDFHAISKNKPQVPHNSLEAF